MEFLDSPWIAYLCLGFGIFTLVTRQLRPEVFGKLEAMKQTFGPRLGYGLHLLAYSLVPIAYGALQLWVQHARSL